MTEGGAGALTPLPPAAHPLCVQRGLSPPRGYPPGCGVLADVELLSFRRAVVVAAPPDAPGLLAKVVLRAGTGLETPHPPYEVEALVQRAALVGAATPFLAAARLRAPLGGALPAFLTQVLSSMRVGEEAEVLVSKQWAGSGGDWPLAAHTPPRWPDGALWRLTLLSMTQVRDMHGDGSLVKRRLAEGSGTFPVDCPLHDCTVTAELQLRVAVGGDGPAPAGEVSTWELGCGAQPPGLEDAIRLMVPGERAAVAAHPRHGYWAQPRGLWAVPPGVGPGDSVEWAVMLLSFQRPLNWHAAEPRACVEDAVAAKEAGVRLYRAGCWALARSRFERVAAQLSGLRGLDGDDEAAALEARRGCLLNAAACCDRLGDHHAAAAHCTVVLQRVDPASAKAHYRRGVSRTATGDWPGAAEDLREAARLDPTAQADCDRALLQLRAAHAKAADTARAQLGGFLDRE